MRNAKTSVNIYRLKKSENIYFSIDQLLCKQSQFVGTLNVNLKVFILFYYPLADILYCEEYFIKICSKYVNGKPN